jgi:phage shock protein PspC (stress-responsive transcriptional regulator)
MKALLVKKLNTLSDLEAEQKTLLTDIANNEKRITSADKALGIMQAAAKLSQDHLAAHLSGIVTQAIQVVIQKPYTFVCEFVERRGSTEADLYLMKDGHRFGILGGTGGGLADVCSATLKVAYLLLSNTDRVLIIDEIARHINSAKQREAFAGVIAGLSKEFGIQMILNSTVTELLAVADNVITLEIVGDTTRVVAE